MVGSLCDWNATEVALARQQQNLEYLYPDGIADLNGSGIFLIGSMGYAPYVVYSAVWKGLPWVRAGVLSRGFLLVG